MTTLENLLSEHNAIIQKIIAEAKKEAIAITSSTSNINAVSYTHLTLPTNREE